jgi:hypothetical protein
MAITQLCEAQGKKMCVPEMSIFFTFGPAGWFQSIPKVMFFQENKAAA